MSRSDAVPTAGAPTPTHASRRTPSRCQRARSAPRRAQNHGAMAPLRGRSDPACTCRCSHRARVVPAATLATAPHTRSNRSVRTPRRPRTRRQSCAPGAIHFAPSHPKLAPSRATRRRRCLGQHLQTSTRRDGCPASPCGPGTRRHESSPPRCEWAVARRRDRPQRAPTLPAPRDR